MNAALKASLYDRSRLKKSHHRGRPDSSDDDACDDDEETDAEATVVNKEGSFYKKLYALIESKSTYINLVLKCRTDKEIENGTTQKKRYLRANRKSQDEEKVERENALKTVREIIKRKFPKRAEGKIDLYLKEIIGNPPPENCALHKTLYQRNQANLFVKHNLISYLLNFVDNKTLMKLKECSKIDNQVVSLYLRKILHTLSFKDDEIKTNIHYWRNVINYFFCKTGTLKPVDRRNYQPVTKEFEKNKSFCVISEDSMDSKVYISLDYFTEKLITSCTHKNPLPHTCDLTNVPKGVEVLLKSEKISIIDFVEEYYKRLIVNDDELMWHICHFRKSRKFLTLLLLEYLKCMLRVLEKYNGSCIFKKTEYLVNCGHHITHRIWIQMFYDYGYETLANQKEEKGDVNRGQRTTGGVPKHVSTKQKNEEQRDSTINKTLYLTIADHFKWDA
ncbi:hypothetical protein PCYB_062610 [Plasmodium cynomolgi strain B]|uniref:Uncharacterized protein n=1 Tax=Plasmodium cynomolgi (strain B) TaxID=1120755 RepID=K6UR68_PLACD|nr:hypothetical protein PCYB_062610 [Plasmodium cynomolgi strain B]GAB65529.1 hypothetical protein PCYB_062610 [Plasmodium cynomolgi strain B]